MKLEAALLVLALAAATPVAATTYQVRYTGKVTIVEGDAQGSEISVGDAIAAQFLFDDALIGSPTVLPIGGGTSTIYFAPISMLTLGVGSYGQSSSQIGASLSYANDSFNQDILTFGVGGLAGGPFGSTFSNVQFQARGATSALDGSGIGNGLPYDRLTPSFFAVFGDGSTSKRVFGNLEVSISPVPESTTWTMMILGFGAIGYAIRRMRVQTAMLRKC